MRTSKLMRRFAVSSVSLGHVFFRAFPNSFVSDSSAGFPGGFVSSHSQIPTNVASRQGSWHPFLRYNVAAGNAVASRDEAWHSTGRCNSKSHRPVRNCVSMDVSFRVLVRDSVLMDANRQKVEVLYSRLPKLNAPGEVITERKRCKLIQWSCIYSFSPLTACQTISCYVIIKVLTRRAPKSGKHPLSYKWSWKHITWKTKHK